MPHVALPGRRRFRARCLNRYGSQMSGIPSSRRPATLASLAAELGVSRTTVSNAYNRPDQLSAPLRARVLEAARRLGYPGPDPVARSLRTRKAGAVGLLLTEALSYAFRDPAATGFLEGLALACEEAGQGLLLVPVSPEQADVTAVHQAGVDGFVVYSVREDDPHFLAVLERPLPIVVCDQPHGVEGVDRVGRRRPRRHARAGPPPHRAGPPPDRRAVHAAGRRAPRRARPTARGRSNITYPVQRDRLAGLRDGLAEVGVDWADVPVMERFDHSVEAGEQAAAELLAAHPEVTAVVCTSDVLALGALRHATEQGLAVPDAPHDHRVRRRARGRAGRADHRAAARAGEGPGRGPAAAAARRPQPAAPREPADRADRRHDERAAARGREVLLRAGERGPGWQQRPPAPRRGSVGSGVPRLSRRGAPRLTARGAAAIGGPPAARLQQRPPAPPGRRTRYAAAVSPSPTFTPDVARPQPGERRLVGDVVAREEHRARRPASGRSRAPLLMSVTARSSTALPGGD